MKNKRILMLILLCFALFLGSSIVATAEENIEGEEVLEGISGENIEGEEAFGEIFGENIDNENIMEIQGSISNDAEQPEIQGVYTNLDDLMPIGEGDVSKDINSVLNGWVEDSDGTHYYIEGKAIVNSGYQIDNQWYYFDSHGVLMQNWFRNDSCIPA